MDSCHGPSNRGRRGGDTGCRFISGISEEHVASITRDAERQPGGGFRGVPIVPDARRSSRDTVSGHRGRSYDGRDNVADGR